MARAGRAAVGGDAGAADGGCPRSVSSHRADPRPARTRAALIAAGQRLLAEGRSDASIQRITETAGVGFGSFFNHFSGKPDLWAAAVSATLRVHGDVVHVLTEQVDDPAEVFCVGLRLTGRLQRASPRLTKVLVNTGVAQLMADTDGLIAHARRDIAAAIDTGRFDIDVELAVHLTAGSVLGLTALLDADPHRDAAALADEYAIRVLRACGLSDADATRLAARPLPDLIAIG